jgi:hypothetical protein
MNEFTNHPADFLQKIVTALGQLKQQLQHDYEKAYPQSREIIRFVLDQQESRAWELSGFPHLLLPDLVEAHLAQLNLWPVATRHDALERYEVQTYESAFAVCG